MCVGADRKLRPTHVLVHWELSMQHICQLELNKAETLRLHAQTKGTWKKVVLVALSGTKHSQGNNLCKSIALFEITAVCIPYLIEKLSLIQ